LDPASLDSAIEWFREQHLEPFLLFERWEEPQFRRRFEHASPLGLLDWPPRYEIDRQVRIYSPVDRDAYIAGHHYATEYVFPR
jgi:hypothetical protein